MRRAKALGIVTLLIGAAALAPAPATAQIVADGHVVETKADGACIGFLTLGTKQRYIDCLNGTIWDTYTGLLWLQDGSCNALGTGGKGTWSEAMEAAATVGHGLDCDDDGTPELTDHSQPGDWRLPTRWEWRQTTQLAIGFGCVSGNLGGPSLTNDAGDDCFGHDAGSSFEGVRLSSEYWSSTSPSSAPGLAWGFDLLDGAQSPVPKSIVPPGLFIWPVREAPAYDGGIVASVGGAPVETAENGPCYDDLGLGQERYVDCGDGTVLDTLTNLLWLRDATCGSLPSGMVDYLDVTDGVAELGSGQCGLTDGSQPGDWRLATEDEWDRTTERAAALGCTNDGAGDPPVLTDSEGTGCLADGSTPFVGLGDVTNLYFWTAETWQYDTSFISVYGLDIASPFGYAKHATHFDVWPWPVRPRETR